MKAIRESDTVIKEEINTNEEDCLLLYPLCHEFNSTCESSGYFQMDWLKGRIQLCNIILYPYESGYITGSLS